eukprot:COSAG01_NODE_7458_length_3204_cov_1.485346_3_plen_185_part_00
MRFYLCDPIFSTPVTLPASRAHSFTFTPAPPPLPASHFGGHRAARRRPLRQAVGARALAPMHRWARWTAMRVCVCVCVCVCRNLSRELPSPAAGSGLQSLCAPSASPLPSAFLCLIRCVSGQLKRCSSTSTSGQIHCRAKHRIPLRCCRKMCRATNLKPSKWPNDASARGISPPILHFRWPVDD